MLVVEVAGMLVLVEEAAGIVVVEEAADIVAVEEGRLAAVVLDCRVTVGSAGVELVAEVAGILVLVVVPASSQAQSKRYIPVATHTQYGYYHCYRCTCASNILPVQNPCTSSFNLSKWSTNPPWNFPPSESKPCAQVCS